MCLWLCCVSSVALNGQFIGTHDRPCVADDLSNGLTLV